MPFIPECSNCFIAQIAGLAQAPKAAFVNNASAASGYRQSEWCIFVQKYGIRGWFMHLSGDQRLSRPQGWGPLCDPCCECHRRCLALIHLQHSAPATILLRASCVCGWRCLGHGVRISCFRQNEHAVHRDIFTFSCKGCVHFD